MTPLRHYLESARDEHRRALYPGDLAADVFALADQERRSRMWRAIWMGAGAASALAACIMVAVLLHRTTPPATPERPAELAALPEMPAMPPIPQGLPLSAPYSSTGDAPALSDVPTMPAMPGWGLSYSTSAEMTPAGG